MLIEEEVAGFRLKVRLGGKHPARSLNSYYYSFKIFPRF